MRDDLWNAQAYANNASAQANWAKERINTLQLKGDEDILDIGCGDGKHTAAMASLTPHGKVVGIDKSLNMIDLAQATYRMHNLFFTQMDAQSIILTNRFDIAFSNAALHWVKDHVSVLEGVKRCLKPHGRIFFSMGGFGNAQEIIEVMTLLIEKPKWKNYFRDFAFPYYFYDTDSYRHWCEF